MEQSLLTNLRDVFTPAVREAMRRKDLTQEELLMRLGYPKVSRFLLIVLR